MLKILSFLSIVSTLFTGAMTTCLVIIRSTEATTATFADYLYTGYGDWLPAVFDSDPDFAISFWLLSFVCSVVLYLSMRLTQIAIDRNQIVRTAAEGIIAEHFGSLRASSLEELGEKVAQRFTEISGEYTDVSLMHERLITDLATVDKQLLPMIAALSPIITVRDQAEAVTARLEDTADQQAVFHRELIAALTKYQPILDRGSELQMRLRDLSDLEAEVEKILELCGEGGINGAIERVRKLNEDVSQLETDSDRLMHHTLRRNESLGDLLPEIRNTLEDDVTNEEVLEEHLDEMSELEALMQKIIKAIGDPDMLIARVQALKTGVDQLKETNERVWNPIPGEDGLEDLLFTLRSTLEDLENYSLEDQVSELTGTAKMLKKARQTIISAGDQLRDDLSVVN